MSLAPESGSEEIRNVIKKKINYSKFINALNKKGVDINRKVLASLAVENPQAFSDIVKFTIN